VADVAPDEEVRVVCKACGAPRIDVDRPGFQLSAAAIEPLRRTEQARSRRRRWRVAGAMGGLGAVGILALALLVQLIAGFSVVGTTLAVLMALPLAIVAAMSVARSARASADVSSSLDEAWLVAARELTQQTETPLTSAELGRALPEAATEQLSAQLAVDDLVSTDVTADGQLAFGSGLRIEPPAVETERARAAAADTLLADSAQAEADAASAAAQGSDSARARALSK
jgi:hypothetical protein